MSPDDERLFSLTGLVRYNRTSWRSDFLVPASPRVRAFVSLVATVATVMHLTFGCCLHAAHFGPAAACHGCPGHEGEADACCMDHEHGHEHESVAEAGADEVSPPGGLAVRAGTMAAGHDCTGCSCTASIEDDAAVRWPASAAPLVTAMADVGVSACVAGIDRARDRGGSPPPRDTHPLHERLLV